MKNGPQLLLSLTYMPTLDRLSVGILRCRNLSWVNKSFKSFLLGTNSKNQIC